MKWDGTTFAGPRGTRPGEIDKLMELVDGIFASNWPVRMRGRFPALFSEENLDNCRIILDGGRPVSHVGYLVRDAVIAGPPIRIASIGAVCTHPDYRKRHLASAILDDCEQRMREQGVDVVFISGTLNIYLRRGARMVGEQFEYELTREVGSTLADGSMEVRPAGVEDIPILAALYNSKLVYHSRSNRDWQRWLEWKLCEKGIATPLVGYLGGKPIAYVAHVDKSRQADDISFACEWAGQASDILKVLASILVSSKRDHVKFTVDSIEDPVLTQALQDAGIEGKEAELWRTVKVLRPWALFEKLRPHLAEPASGIKVTNVGEGARLELESEVLDLAVEEVARAFFSDPTGELPQKFASAGKLGRALLDTFPLPLPRYGYNYI